MTGDLLQSDIDLARRLIDAGKTDTEIVIALGYRRIASEKSQRLVHDLREGMNVEPDPLRDENLWRPVVAEGAEPYTEPSSPAPARQAADSRFPWFRVILLGVVAVTIVAVFLFNRDRGGTQVKQVSATSRDLMTEPAATLRRPVLQVEVEPHSVRVGGTVLSRENALKTLSDLAGALARTNRLDDLTIYAFDDLGAVLYSDSKAGKDSLLLYFEPVGGINGAQHAFTGTLAIRGKSVTLTTDPKTLLELPELDLKETATSVFSGQSNGLGLSFAYLNSRTQLSLVQIDLE
jgi:hypothetical protein